MTPTGPSAAATVRDPAADGRACDVCDGRAFRLLHAWPVGDPWNPATIPIAVWTCLGCGLVLLHPVPAQDQLPDRGEWWSLGRKRRRRFRRFKELRQRLRTALVGGGRFRLVKSTRRAVSKGRLLEVGCGVGTLLAQAAPFYDCVGLEPSPVAAAEARRRGFAVIEAAFEDAAIEPASFDVVVLDSVIEHLESPTAALAKAHRVLRPGGVVAVKTPKFGGVSCRLHGAAWNGFRHGYHRFLFSGATLGRCLERAGFEVLRRPRRDMAFDDILILWGRKAGG
jgi:SAM-dependent methyltransferase